MSKIQKLITLSAIIIFIIVIILIIIQAGKEEKTEEIVLKDIENPRLTISEEEILSPMISGEKLIYYNPNTAVINSFDPLTRKISIIKSGVLKTDKLSDIIWSPKMDQVIIIKSSEWGIEQYHYNLTTGEEKKLDPAITNPIWSPDGTKIAYQYYSTDEKRNSLNISNPDGSNWQKIQYLELSNYELMWLADNKKIVLTPYFTPDHPGEGLEILNLETKELKKITQDKKLSNLKASPTENIVAFEIYHSENNTTSLGFYNFDKGEFKDLGLNTFTSRFFWSEEGKYILYAASEKGLGNDDIHIIDLESLKQYKIPLSKKENYLITHIIFNEKNKNLYFISSDNLYSLTLTTLP